MKNYYSYIALLLVSTTLFFNNAYASSVYAAVRYSALSVNYPGITESSTSGTVSVLHSAAGIAQTSLGHVSGGINQTKYRNVVRINNNFRMDNLRLSYIGAGIGQSTINGEVHLSHEEAIVAGAGQVALGLDIGGNGPTYWKVFDNTGAFNPMGSGVMTASRSFRVGEVFSLAFYGRMSIAGRGVGPTEPQAHNWLASGSYRAHLGGSPVFNLPKGYVVNSDDGRIVNNWYTGLDAPSAVPVPAAIWLMGSGLIGLLGVRRKKS